MGERFYGYFPMADEVVLQPAHLGERGFVDAAPRRRELASVYNQYLRCRTDPFYREDEEALIALLRPLFITSFLIDDFLYDNALFAARQILISSASSKTAYGLAFCLGARSQAADSATVVGLTSPSNAEFTRALGCYDDVLVYQDASRIDIDAPTVYVDMSGDAGVRAAVPGAGRARVVAVTVRHLAEAQLLVRATDMKSRTPWGA